jgi:diguanylate cyclase (GGDEF)-like protein
MLLDVVTLTFAGGFVTCASGLFLSGYWWRHRTAWAAFWWAMANTGAGVGIILLIVPGRGSDYVADIIGPLILDLCAALTFVAARVFNRGSVDPLRMIAGIVAWFVMQAVAGAIASDQIAAVLGMSVSAGFFAAAALEFLLGRTEMLPGRWPMIVLLGLQATAIFLAGVQFALATRFSAMPSIGWLGSVHFVGLIYALGATVCLVTMLNGRLETEYKFAALTDPLTGLANRRALMDIAQRVLDRGAHDGSPVAVLAFDLDHFKRINDTFGHATGDQVLCAFADVLSATLRPNNIVARVGGEEFVAMVPGAGDDAAVAIARRIGEAFQKVGQFTGGQKVEATVSAGVATTGGRKQSVADMLASADAALYRAKSAGRNRVALAGGEPDGLPPGNVIRIA